MQSRSPRRPHKRAADRTEILTAFEASGLSSRDFARQHGICVSTLYRWRRLSPTHQDNPARACLIELPGGLDTRPSLSAYRLLFPGGVTLEVAPGFNPDELRTLTELLRVP